MMNYDTLEVSISGGVAHIWMNRPDRHNSFDETLIYELMEVFLSLDSDPEVRVVVLGGRGKSFSAGADLNWMKRAADYTIEENLRDARVLSKMLATINRLSKPTVARVHGAALGGGAGLTAACDIAIASVDAYFATTEVRFGIIPGAISPYILAAIGPRAASRYFLSSERFTAGEAHKIGLVHEVCVTENLDIRIDEISKSLLAGGPAAQSLAKQLIRDVAYRHISSELIELAATRIASARATPEAREGISAFLEKRSPAWMASCN